MAGTEPTLADLANRVRQLEDDAAIRDLARQYSLACMTLNAEAFANVFAQDGVMDMTESVAASSPGPVLTGRAAIAEGFGKMLGKRFKVLQVMPVTHHVEIAGDLARGWVWWIYSIVGSDGRMRMGFGTYRDDYVMTTEGWKIKRRRDTTISSGEWSTSVFVNDVPDLG